MQLYWSQFHALMSLWLSEKWLDVLFVVQNYDGSLSQSKQEVFKRNNDNDSKIVIIIIILLLL